MSAPEAVDARSNTVRSFLVGDAISAAEAIEHLSYGG